MYNNQRLSIIFLFGFLVVTTTTMYNEIYGEQDLYSHTVFSSIFGEKEDDDNDDQRLDDLCKDSDNSVCEKLDRNGSSLSNDVDDLPFKLPFSIPFP